MMKDQERYRELAAQARADADRADLANVRDRCLRAETAWIIMAERAERTERLRAAHEMAKAHEAAKVQEAAKAASLAAELTAERSEAEA